MSIIILSPEFVCKDKSKIFNHQIFYDIFYGKINFFLYSLQIWCKINIKISIIQIYGLKNNLHTQKSTEVTNKHTL